MLKENVLFVMSILTCFALDVGMLFVMNVCKNYKNFVVQSVGLTFPLIWSRKSNLQFVIYITNFLINKSATNASKMAKITATVRIVFDVSCDSFMYTDSTNDVDSADCACTGVGCSTGAKG